MCIKINFAISKKFNFNKKNLLVLCETQDTKVSC